MTIGILIYAVIGFALAGIVAVGVIYFYAAYDAYKTAQRINRGEEEFIRKSRLFWVPVVVYMLAAILLVLALVIFTFYPAHFNKEASPAGIIQGTSVPVSPDSKAGNLAGLMAIKQDLPGDYAAPVVRLMEDAEYSSGMRSLGAITGYRGYYRKTPITEGSLWVGHYIVIFPDDSKAREMVEKDKATYDALKSEAKQGVYDCSSIGDHCTADKTAGKNPEDTEFHYHISLSFSKGNIYERLWTVGPDPDYDMIKDLATSSAVKIS